MEHFAQFVGPHRTLQLFGVKLIGVNADTGYKLLMSVVFVAAVYFIGRGLRWLAYRKAWSQAGKRFAFWTHQSVSITVAIIFVIGLVSIWVDNTARLTTAAGIVTAGLAFALQKPVTSFAAYIVILRGKTFSVGDRITMGGIRGDVISLSFLQTAIMEMGQPAVGDQGDTAWVQARQYTGRIVRVTNGVIFDNPVYNYTREFPYVWEEMRIPITYTADRARAEQILLDAAHRHTVNIQQMSEAALHSLEERYVLKSTDLEPKVYWRLTDNWLEMTVRFIVEESGIREVKNQISRQIMEQFDEAGIGIASATYDVVGVPPLRVQMVPGANGNQEQGSPA